MTATIKTQTFSSLPIGTHFRLSPSSAMCVKVSPKSYRLEEDDRTAFQRYYMKKWLLDEDVEALL